MKRSDKVENRVRIEMDSKGEPSLWDILRVSYTNKALLKHIIDNDLRHIWRIIFIILSYLVIATAGFFIRGIL